MNLKQHHTWVIYRLSILSLIMIIVALLIKQFPWNDQVSGFYVPSLLITSGINFIAVIYFILQSTNSTASDFEELVPIGKLSRNIYLFSVLMFFTGFMTMSSSAGRVSYFFFLLGSISMPIAHVCYAIWIKKIVKLLN